MSQTFMQRVHLFFALEKYSVEQQAASFFLPPVAVLGWRIFALLYTFMALIVSIRTSDDTWLIYLTHWSFLLIVVYFAVASYQSLRFVRKHPERAHVWPLSQTFLEEITEAERREGHIDHELVPAAHQVMRSRIWLHIDKDDHPKNTFSYSACDVDSTDIAAMILHEINLTSSTIVSFVFWAFLNQGFMETNPSTFNIWSNFNVHGTNIIFVFIEFMFVSRYQLRISHVLFIYLYALLYIISSIITDYILNSPVYFFLNYESPGAILGIFLGVIILFVIILHLAFYGMSLGKHMLYWHIMFKHLNVTVPNSPTASVHMQITSSSLKGTTDVNVNNDDGADAPKSKVDITINVQSEVERESQAQAEQESQSEAEQELQSEAAMNLV